MLAAERRQGILERIRATGTITVPELSAYFRVSDETIRRDLTRMEDQGLLLRIHGGAVFKSGMHDEVPFALRNVAHVQEKDLIGRRAADLVENGDTVFLDASTTALHVGRHLTGKQNIVVISNAIAVAYRLSEAAGVKIISIGGTLRQSSLTNVGPDAEDAVARYYADRMFFSCDGINRLSGLTDANEHEARVRKMMLHHSNHRILVADSTKFDRTSFVLIDDFRVVDMVITDQRLSREWMSFFQNKGIEYICCADCTEP